MSPSAKLAIVLAIFSSIALGQSGKPAPPPGAPIALASGNRPEADSDQQANRQDLQKMRAILNQMRTNLAFVGSTTTPLNHQFELEIDMWQALLDRMERRNEAGRQSKEH